MGDEQLKQLQDHETRLHSLEKQREVDSEKLDKILYTVTRMEAKAEDQHTPQNCSWGWQIKDHESRIRSLEESSGERKGGSRVVSWIFGPSGIAILAVIVAVLALVLR